MFIIKLHWKVGKEKRSVIQWKEPNSQIRIVPVIRPLEMSFVLLIHYLSEQRTFPTWLATILVTKNNELLCFDQLSELSWISTGERTINEMRFAVEFNMVAKVIKRIRRIKGHSWLFYIVWLSAQDSGSISVWKTCVCFDPNRAGEIF